MGGHEVMSAARGVATVAPGTMAPGAMARSQLLSGVAMGTAAGNAALVQEPNTQAATAVRMHGST